VLLKQREEVYFSLWIKKETCCVSRICNDFTWRETTNKK
jgi:hypothetical protein